MHLLGVMLMSDLEHIMQANAKKAKTPPPPPQVISHEVQTPPGWQRSDKLDPSLYGEHALKGAELAGHQLEPPFSPAGTAKPAATAGKLASGIQVVQDILWCTCPSGVELARQQHPLLGLCEQVALLSCRHHGGPCVAWRHGQAVPVHPGPLSEHRCGLPGALSPLCACAAL